MPLPPPPSEEPTGESLGASLPPSKEPLGESLGASLPPPEEILGESLGTSLGASLRVPFPPEVGASLGASLGTSLGTKLLEHIPEERFPAIYKTALTLVALRLVWSGIAERAFGSAPPTG